MAFTDKDREMLVKTHTTVKMMKESHERRLKDLEDEDKLLHHRINKVTKIYVGASAALAALAGAVTAWFKTQTGGQ